jgi:prepilin-type N-terminal cleavage/methylation domain-containing protein
MKNSVRGFTLIELLVVMAVVAILASIALPFFNTIQEKAQITQDLSNLRQLGIATQTYLNDHDAVLFTSGGIWMTALHPKYLPSWKIFQSPFDKRGSLESDTAAPISYGVNGNDQVVGLTMDKVKNRRSSFSLLRPKRPERPSLLPELRLRQ